MFFAGALSTITSQNASLTAQVASLKQQASCGFIATL